SRNRSRTAAAAATRLLRIGGGDDRHPQLAALGCGMKAAGQHHPLFLGRAISLAVVAVAVAAAFYAAHRASIHPSTDDATIDADVVHVAAAVGGRLVTL